MSAVGTYREQAVQTVSELCLKGYGLTTYDLRKATWPLSRIRLFNHLWKKTKQKKNTAAC